MTMAGLEVYSEGLSEAQSHTNVASSFDNLFVYNRATDTQLCNVYKINCSPPLSPFLNPFEETFNEFS